MPGHNHLLQSLRTALFLTPPGAARDLLLAIRLALWTDNAHAEGAKVDPVSRAELARARRLARAAGHRLKPWEQREEPAPPPPRLGAAVVMHVAACRDCRAPIFVYPGGFSPIFPCFYRPTKRGPVRFKRPTFGSW